MFDLSSLTNLLNISLPIKSIKIVFAIVLSLGIAFSSYKVTSWYYGKEIIKLENTVSQYEESYNHLAELTAKQNEGIANLKNLQDRKTKQLEIAQNAARNASKALYDAANTLQRKTINNASEACLEASKLIDEELSKERVK